MARSATVRPSSPATPHVALLVETSLASGRDILMGIARYVREHRPWSLFHEARGLEERLPRWLEGWRGHGIIARVQSPAMARALRRTGLPVVDVLGIVPGSGFPVVHVDDAAIGSMAANHLLDRGLRHFAFYGLERENWSTAREAAFCATVGREGLPVEVRRDRRHAVNDQTWERHQEALTRWVAGLPKPVGIMVCSDQRGSLLLDACRRAGTAVPDEASIIGVDNDEPLCSVCHPPLTSVWPNHALVGYEAAALLQGLMSGSAASPARVRTPPKTIVTRQSTDTLAVTDEIVARSLRVIRDRACARLRVDDLARAVGASRSVLQRRFRAALHCSINEKLIGHRLDTARRLLTETTLTLPDIAERSGFEHAEYMAYVFRRRVGISPAQFRARTHH
ncbi:MAG: DNA-binding transcriptional regulator [Verrucomicrobia bacterium]|jgi:LacI family transcriptional regulator|nr:DNA-binding transcriptional regulator [Verrucomicrobiota bacterium]